MKPVKCVCGGQSIMWIGNNAVECSRHEECSREILANSPKEAILMWNAAQKELKKRKKK